MISLFYLSFFCSVLPFVCFPCSEECERKGLVEGKARSQRWCVLLSSPHFVCCFVWRESEREMWRKSSEPGLFSSFLGKERGERRRERLYLSFLFGSLF